MNVSKVVVVKPQAEPYVEELDDSHDAMTALFHENGLGSMSPPDITIIETKHDFEHDYIIAAVSEDGAMEYGLPGNRKVDEVVIAGIFAVMKFEQACGFSRPVSLTDEEIAHYIKKFKTPQQFVIRYVDGSNVYIDRKDYEKFNDDCSR